MKLKLVTQFNKIVCKEWMTIVAPQTIKHFLRTVQDHCSDCKESDSQNLLQNESACNHSRFSSIYQYSSLHSSINNIPAHTSLFE